MVKYFILITCHRSTTLWFKLTGKSWHIIIILYGFDNFGHSPKYYPPIFGVNYFTKVFSRQNLYYMVLFCQLYIHLYCRHCLQSHKSVAHLEVLYTSVSVTQIHAQHVFLQLKAHSSSQLSAFPAVLAFCKLWRLHYR